MLLEYNNLPALTIRYRMFYITSSNNSLNGNFVYTNFIQNQAQNSQQNSCQIDAADLGMPEAVVFTTVIF